MTKEKKRKPLVAGLLSFLSPGLGFLYNGFLARGIIVTLCYIVLELIFWLVGAYKSFPSAIVAEALLTGIWIYFIFYNISQARKIGLLLLKSFNRWYVYPLYIVISVGISYYINEASDVESFTMSSVSMLPAIKQDEKLIIDNGYYQKHEINFGDVILLGYPNNPKELTIKRCIALGGDTVEMRDGLAYVNNKWLLPSLLLNRTGMKIESPEYKDPRIVPKEAGNNDFYSPLVVPRGTIFVLGDHRDMSYDSRYVGPIDRNNIAGKVLYIWWSSDISRIGKTIR